MLFGRELSMASYYVSLTNGDCHASFEKAISAARTAAPRNVVCAAMSVGVLLNSCLLSVSCLFNLVVAARHEPPF